MNMKSNVFLDFDGTLIDSKTRLYTLFVKMTNASKISYDDYWEKKKQGYNQNRMLAELFQFTEPECQIFKKKWVELIEQKDYLKMDKKQVWAEPLLEILRVKYHIILWTNRSNKANLVWELERLQLTEFLDEILITEHRCTKQELLFSYKRKTPQDIVIGDTEEDYLAAFKNGLQCFLVNSEMYDIETMRTKCSRGFFLDGHELTKYLKEDIKENVDGYKGNSL